MTTGELDYDGIFRLDPSGGSDGEQEIAFPPVSFILWILFIVIMPVILTNMLVRTYAYSYVPHVSVANTSTYLGNFFFCKD